MRIDDLLMMPGNIDPIKYEELIKKRDALYAIIRRTQSKIFDEEDSMSVFTAKEKTDKDPRYMKHFKKHEELLTTYSRNNKELTKVLKALGVK